MKRNRVARMGGALALNREGLLHSKNISTARELFLKAVRSFERVAHEAERLTARYGDDGTLVDRAGALRQEALVELQDALLDIASASLVRGRFNDALGSNKVLAVDPHNGEARALRARIEIAANENYRY